MRKKLSILLLGLAIVGLVAPGPSPVEADCDDWMEYKGITCNGEDTGQACQCDLPCSADCMLGASGDDWRCGTTEACAELTLGSCFEGYEEQMCLPQGGQCICSD
jgi:hypothetical protein